MRPSLVARNSACASQVRPWLSFDRNRRVTTCPGSAPRNRSGVISSARAQVGTGSNCKLVRLFTVMGVAPPPSSSGRAPPAGPADRTVAPSVRVKMRTAPRIGIEFQSRPATSCAHRRTSLNMIAYYPGAALEDSAGPSGQMASMRSRDPGRPQWRLDFCGIQGSPATTGWP